MIISSIKQKIPQIQLGNNLFFLLINVCLKKIESDFFCNSFPTLFKMLQTLRRLRHGAPLLSPFKVIFCLFAFISVAFHAFFICFFERLYRSLRCLLLQDKRACCHCCSCYFCANYVTFCCFSDYLFFFTKIVLEIHLNSGCMNSSGPAQCSL